MLDTLKGLGKGLLGSKKVVAAIAGALAVVGVRFLGLDDAAAADASLKITGIAVAYLLGQGAADHGKEKAKAELVEA